MSLLLLPWRCLTPLAEEKGATYLSFDELLQQAQLITLHCPLTPETRHLLSDEQFAKMQDGVFIVNTARGPGMHPRGLPKVMTENFVKWLMKSHSSVRCKAER